ncbi:hypothetical protein DC426_26095, partial [Priestia megaterium]
PGDLYVVFHVRTTNGSLLKKHAEALSKAGLSRVTVSLDSLDEVRFQELNGNRGSVKRVLEGIEAACGYDRLTVFPVYFRKKRRQ